MKLLTVEELGALEGMTVSNLPKSLLWSLSHETSQHYMQLVSKARRTLPWSIPQSTSKYLVDSILDWFVENGDVEKEPRGRYHCIPGYLIEYQVTNDNVFLSLFGSPSVENALKIFLTPVGGKLLTENVIVEKDQSPEVPLKHAIGLKRQVICPLPDKNEVYKKLLFKGISVIEPSALMSRLPRFSQVFSPVFTLPPNEVKRPGVWETYDAKKSALNRWTQVSDPQPMHQDRLLRWRPSDAWQDLRNSQIFYQDQSGNLAELGYEESKLWEFFFDEEAENPKQMFWNGQQFWLPRSLPITTLQWVRIRTMTLESKDYGWAVFKSDYATARDVSHVLNDTLAVEWCEGEPNFRG